MTDDTAAAAAAAGIVPVIVIDDPARGPHLMDALVEGGIRCVEITMRTPAALEVISAAVAAHPDLLVGAGTVLSRDDVDRAADAGAAFAISPGLDDGVLDRARERGLVAVPGVATATEVQRAVAAGLGRVKFFPAEQLGGLPTISALSGPFPDVRFLPSGGLTAANAGGYLRHPAVFAISGAWMASRAMIASGEFDEITRLSRAAVDLLAVRTAHT